MANNHFGCVDLLKRFVALVVACLLILVLAGGVSSYYFPLTNQGFNLNIGQEIFKERCSACHSLDAKAGPKMGPNLAQVGINAATRKPGLNAPAYILESILDPNAYRVPGTSGQMPEDAVVGIRDRDLLNLVAYLASQGTKPNFYDVTRLKPTYVQRPSQQRQPLDLALIEKGQSLFNETYHCNACHSIYPEPSSGLLAPNLSYARQLSIEYLRESIVNPSAFIAPGYTFVSLITADNRQLYGRLLDQSASAITIVTSTDKGHFETVHLRRDEIKTKEDGQLEFTISPISPMPPFALPPDDLDALLQFLKILG